MSDRTNFAKLADLQSACDEARTTLRRKRATIEEVREAAQALNKAVRTLRSWLDSRNDELRSLRRERIAEKRRALQGEVVESRKLTPEEQAVHNYWNETDGKE